MVILDSNIIIDALRLGGKPSLLSRIVKQHPDEVFAISIISVQELYEGKSTLLPEQEQKLLSLIATLEIIPYDYNVAKKAGEIARDIKHSIDLADAAIAATAILNKSSLFTVNKKDFIGIENIVLV